MALKLREVTVLDINSFINKMDKDSIKKLNKIVNTPMGQDFLKRLKGVDKNQIMRQLAALNEGDLPREELVRQLAGNPDLLKKLNDFLDRK